MSFRTHIVIRRAFLQPTTICLSTRDLFTALQSGTVCHAVRELLVRYVRTAHPDVDVIVGLEARGFLFSLMLAAELRCGCVPIRKAGKLPGTCVQQKYQLEYGSDVFEMQQSAIKSGQKVVIVDDLLATGGTLEAAVQLIRSAGGEVLECVVLMELVELDGRPRANAPVHSFIKY